MKNIIIAFMTAALFLGCGSKEESTQTVAPKLLITQSIADLSLNDQHGKPYTIAADTKTLIFAFSKDVGHTCNDFFATKDESYLSDNHAVFIADVSSAPSLIRNMFIMPGLKDFKHTVLVIDDKSIASGYKAGQDNTKIIVVSLSEKTITAVNGVNTVQDLASKIEVQ